MKIWKRCAGLVLALACCLGLLSGCGQEAAEGMKLSVCVGSAPRELDPIYATDPADQTILMHLYENLMRTAVDVSGGTSASSGVAKSVQQEENTDGTVTCTFKLRGAKWSDGQAVTASDFVYAWQRLADPANDSPYASLLSVVAGYDTVRSTGDVTALKVSAKNDSTLVVELNGKYDWFLTVVCTSPATLPVRQDVIEAWQTQTAEAAAQAEGEPVEVEPWWADTSGLVTNGPYQVSGETDDALTLTASETYSGTQSGPAELTFRYADTPEEAQSLYENKEVDFVSRVTDDQLTKLVEEESPSLIQELGVYTILFNCRQEQLADPQVRAYLAEQGYHAGGSCRDLLRQLAGRLCFQEGFPHEIGLFLGYPLADVEGFIRNKGQGYACCGLWKSYGDPGKARRYFDRCRACTAAYKRRYADGVPLEQMIVAA